MDKNQRPDNVIPISGTTKSKSPTSLDPTYLQGYSCNACNKIGLVPCGLDDTPVAVLNNLKAHHNKDNSCPWDIHNIIIHIPA